MTLDALAFDQRKALWLWCDTLGSLQRSPAYELAGREWPSVCFRQTSSISE